ncbi:ATP-binding protein [Streptomyces sp. NPDC090083]|uniref:ATP-binding protein n=1 Tax=Streptomyces sp. NPDC090083 TaxID=3365941 RepID=UPI0037F5E118
MTWMTLGDDFSFVGREEELELIRAAMSGSRMVTITGAGGVGKTRLARQTVAPKMAADGHDVAWVDLSPLRNADLLAATVADACGLSDHTPRMPTESISAWIGDREVLVVLDSCEHLSTECRNVAGNLLTACERLRILATSREPLRVRGETLVPIGPLATSEEAVTLFADRAAQAGSPLEDEGDRQLAARLCDELDRLPLALELAAAQLRTMSLTELCAAPRSAVDLPQSTGYRPTPRHAGLRTSIGWSHELCSPLERLLWARLSFLPGSFDENTAWKVASGGPLSPSQVSRTLAALADKSVITRQDGVYRMLDTIREYGRMWLHELGGEQEMARRHAEHLLSETRQAHQEWFGPAQRDWYRRIDLLHDDIRLAADYFLATDPTAALELIGHVSFFWVCSGYLYEGRRYLEQAAALGAGAEQDETRVQGLWSLGLALTLQGEHDAAHKVAVDCRRTAEATFDAEGLGRAVYLEGLLHLLEGRPMTASSLVESVEFGVAVSRPGQLTAATALCSLVHVFGLTGSGRLAQARQEAAELRDICVESDEYWTRSYLEHQLSLIAVLEGRTKDAVAHARAALHAKRHIGDAFGIAMVLDVLAIALTDAGEEDSAVYAFGAAARFWETVGHPQRGTPELAPLREQCEERLVACLGTERFEKLFRRAAAADNRTLTAWAAHGGPVPET